MVELRNLIRVNNSPLDTEVENDAKLRYKMMFPQNGGVPALKPLTELRMCGEELECGHSCGGCKGESETNHLPCLEPECRDSEQVTKLDSCQVCTDALGEQPSLELGCGHVFHAGCIRELLRHRWSTQRITFNFMKCPSCQQNIESQDTVPEIRQEISAMKVLMMRLSNEALKEIKLDDRENHPRLQDQSDRFYQKPQEYALHVSEFYECSRCHIPFFGGYVDCQDEMFVEQMQAQEDDMEEEQLMCQSCRLTDMEVREQFVCNKHGLRHIQFKCDFCCNLAQFRCRANSYFCDECHENPNRRDKFNCGGNMNKCPYSIKHHPTKKGVPIAGCILCVSSLQKKNLIKFEDQHEAHLKKVLHETDMQLKNILLHKADSARHIQSARRSSMSSQASSASEYSANSPSAGFQGRLAF